MTTLSSTKRVVVESTFSNNTITLESGWIAKQAGGAVWQQFVLALQNQAKTFSH